MPVQCVNYEVDGYNAEGGEGFLCKLLRKNNACGVAGRLLTYCTLLGLQQALQMPKYLHRPPLYVVT